MPRIIFSHILAAVLLLISSILVSSCIFFTQPPRFRATHDLQENSEIRGFPVSREMAWKYTKEALLGNYRLLKEDKAQGLILTQWKKQIIKETGHMSACKMHGVNIETRTEYLSRQEMGEFELRNRLYIIVEGTADSSTISVTNYYVARPKDDTYIYFEPEFVEVDYVIKAFSMSDFDTREQHLVLNRIGKLLDHEQK